MRIINYFVEIKVMNSRLPISIYKEAFNNLIYKNIIFNIKNNTHNKDKAKYNVFITNDH
jgi:hypothetical protein